MCKLIILKKPSNPYSTVTENKEVPKEICKMARGRGFKNCNGCDKNL